MKTLFFPGGPGFNGKPERELLTAPFRSAGHELVVWDEPSLQRPSGPAFDASDAWASYIASAEAFFLEHSAEAVMLVGHSFGCQVIVRLAAAYSERIAKLVYVASTLSPFDADQNIFRAMRDDYAAHGEDAPARELDAVLAQQSRAFDDNQARGFVLAAQNPRLFDGYWFQKARMAEFLSHYQGENAVDVDAFLSVRRTLPPLPIVPLRMPAIAVFGAHEAIVVPEIELALIHARHGDVTAHELDASGHYPHIEQTREFLALLG